MSNPFSATQAPQAPQAPQAAPAAPKAAPVAPREDDAKKPTARKKPNRQMTNDERKYVIENYASKNTSIIAEELGLTRQQVYRTVHESRNKLNERLAELETQPKSPEVDEAIKKVQEFLDKLPSKPFGAGQGGKRRSSIDTVLDDLLG